jgi:hypothetical protein
MVVLLFVDARAVRNQMEPLAPGIAISPPAPPFANVKNRSCSRSALL